MVQELKITDLCIHSILCQDMLTRIDENENFIRNVWKFDEKHFHLNSFVNKQNDRY